MVTKRSLMDTKKSNKNKYKSTSEKNQKLCRKIPSEMQIKQMINDQKLA